MLMCDIDRFKDVNDTYGHHVGDDTLSRFDTLLLEATENAGIARFGGEEFVIILEEDDAATGLAVAERIRAAVERNDWDDIVPGLQLTISCGVT